MSFGTNDRGSALTIKPQAVRVGVELSAVNKKSAPAMRCVFSYGRNSRFADTRIFPLLPADGFVKALILIKE